MKKYYRLLALTSVLILILVTSAFINIQFTTYYLKNYISDITNHLFEVQIKHISIFTAIICDQISQEAQKIPTYTNLLNSFVGKVLNDITNIQHNYRNSLVNYYLLQKNEEDPSFSFMISKNSGLVNNWQSDQFYYINDLDQEYQSYILKLSLYNILQRPIQYMNNQFQNERSILYDNIFYVTQKYELILNSRNNTIFDCFLSDQCSINGFSSNNLICQSWFQNAINQTQNIFFSPKLLKNESNIQIAQLQCRQLQYPNNQSQNKLTVFCIQSIISKLNNYFINLGNMIDRTYLIESLNQTIIYQSNSNLTINNLENLYQNQFQYQDVMSETQYLSTQVQNFLSNITYFYQNNPIYIQHGVIQNQQQIRYKSNNTKYVIILSPTIIQQQSFLQSQKKNSSQLNYNYLKIPYLVINVLQEGSFNGWKQNQNSTLDTIFIIMTVGMILFWIFTSLLVNFYLFRHFYLIDEQVGHLTHILNQMAAQKFNYDIAYNSTKKILICFETKLLLQTFQDIYQILLYTSENFFDSNDTETLIKLSKNLKFFQGFGNKHAEGITFNNIGALLMGKGHIFEALEYFTSSIICAKYEIQQFCQENPISLTTFLISEFGYQSNIEELIFEQNQRYSIKLQKEKSRSSTSKQSFSQKTAFSSVKQQKQQITTSQQMHVDQYLQEQARQFNQFLKNKNLKIFNNNENEIKDQFQEQRFFLLQSLLLQVLG
ncbi:transmembrane protein, putative (macronuclear) [Tetrahymena thermophila SB210]|uniref:Transmembrane protein, putative n=1 Tax=Tetrahymena thermophila (strain SB210) TaxID=312017 RepID=I7MKH1_TETTS|nr:transmembrane protein, putative [Tetrahymena thermophila SB210]EAR98416.2 transmembrane protein, putative [Tetrahymena thermophila SB210]|eukprot:XP_001018661.2 transmembrane protein, putative [Tetrahymena thermophila SB210]